MNNIANYIREILLTQLMVVFSWGAHNFKAIGESEEGEGGLEFEVYLLNQDGTIKEKISDIYVDSLVYVLDHAIEKVDNYEERVKREYSIQ